MGRDRKRVAGRDRTVGLLLELTGPEGPGERQVLCRSQLAAVGVLAGGAGRRDNDAGVGYSFFAGRLPVIRRLFLRKRAIYKIMLLIG